MTFLPPEQDRKTFPGQADPAHDSVNRPPHYTAHPSGVECIEITEYFNFCLGNAVKYIWRADLKHDDIEDLKKARWYIDREIHRRTALKTAAAVEKSCIKLPDADGQVRVSGVPYSVAQEALRRMRNADDGD